MEDQTKGVLLSIGGDEFKAEITRRDNIIRALNVQQETIKANIDIYDKEVGELMARISNLKKEIADAYAEKEAVLETEKSNFELSKNGSLLALTTKESEIVQKINDHDIKVKEHLASVQEFNIEKSNFDIKRNSILSKLEEEKDNISRLINDMIGALK